MRSTSYRVGYRRPPAATRFKLGVSGNPKGRPRGARNYKGIMVQLMNELLLAEKSAAVATEGGAEASGAEKGDDEPPRRKRPRKTSRVEIILEGIVDRAIAGDMTALTQAWELIAALDTLAEP